VIAKSSPETPGWLIALSRPADDQFLSRADLAPIQLHGAVINEHFNYVRTSTVEVVTH